MFYFIFTISLIIVVTLAVSGMYEVRSGKKWFVGRALSKFDLAMTAFVNRQKLIFLTVQNYLRNFLSHHLPSHMRVITSSSRDAFKTKYFELLPNIRGSRIISKNGNASEFLKHITEHKKENGGGKIEEPEYRVEEVQ